MKNKYGYNTHRLKRDDKYNDLEVLFADIFNEEFKYGNSDFLEKIVGKKNSEGTRQYLTEEEEKVALSVIQWLGTPVGQGFLEKVEKRFKNIPKEV